MAAEMFSAACVCWPSNAVVAMVRVSIKSEADSLVENALEGEQRWLLLYKSLLLASQRRGSLQPQAAQAGWVGGMIDDRWGAHYACTAATPAMFAASSSDTTDWRVLCKPAPIEQANMAIYRLP